MPRSTDPGPRRSRPVGVLVPTLLSSLVCGGSVLALAISGTSALVESTTLAGTLETVAPPPAPADLTVQALAAATPSTPGDVVRTPTVTVTVTLPAGEPPGTDPSQAPVPPGATGGRAPDAAGTDGATPDAPGGTTGAASAGPTDQPEVAPTAARTGTAAGGTAAVPTATAASPAASTPTGTATSAPASTGTPAEPTPSQATPTQATPALATPTQATPALAPTGRDYELSEAQVGAAGLG